MKCDRAMEKFLEMDNGASFGLFLRVHMLRCDMCRNEIRQLKKHFESLITETPFPMGVNIEDAVMREIYDNDPGFNTGISCFKWISAGLVLVASSFLVTYSKTNDWLTGYFGSVYEIPLNIVLGLGITIYIILFIGSHVDDLKDYINFPFRRM